MRIPRMVGWPMQTSGWTVIRSNDVAMMVLLGIEVVLTNDHVGGVSDAEEEEQEGGLDELPLQMQIGSGYLYPPILKPGRSKNTFEGDSAP